MFFFFTFWSRVVDYCRRYYKIKCILSQRRSSPLPSELGCYCTVIVLNNCIGWTSTETLSETGSLSKATQKEWEAYSFTWELPSSSKVRSFCKPPCYTGTFRPQSECFSVVCEEVVLFRLLSKVVPRTTMKFRAQWKWTYLPPSGVSEKTVLNELT